MTHGFLFNLGNNDLQEGKWKRMGHIKQGSCNIQRCLEKQTTAAAVCVDYKSNGDKNSGRNTVIACRLCLKCARERYMRALHSQLSREAKQQKRQPNSRHHDARRQASRGFILKNAIEET